MTTPVPQHLVGRHVEAIRTAAKQIGVDERIQLAAVILDDVVDAVRRLPRMVGPRPASVASLADAVHALRNEVTRLWSPVGTSPAPLTPAQSPDATSP